MRMESDRRNKEAAGAGLPPRPPFLTVDLG